HQQRARLARRDERAAVISLSTTQSARMDGRRMARRQRQDRRGHRLPLGPEQEFLADAVEVKRPGSEPIQVSQRVGWDGHNGKIRSWVFDSQGGFGEGYWERQGNRWVVSKAGILPDGGTGTATNVYEFVDQNKFVWRATDREVDGQPLSDTEIKFQRKTAK